MRFGCTFRFQPFAADMRYGSILVEKEGEGSLIQST